MTGQALGALGSAVGAAIGTSMYNKSLGDNTGTSDLFGLKARKARRYLSGKTTLDGFTYGQRRQHQSNIDYLSNQKTNINIGFTGLGARTPGTYTPLVVTR